MKKKLNIMCSMQNNMIKRQKLLQKLEKSGTVTIATNMAGRGTDIKLGGNKDFVEERVKNDLADYEKNEKQRSKI